MCSVLECTREFPSGDSLDLRYDFELLDSHERFAEREREVDCARSCYSFDREVEAVQSGGVTRERQAGALDPFQRPDSLNTIERGPGRQDRRFRCRVGRRPLDPVQKAVDPRDGEVIGVLENEPLEGTEYRSA